MYGELVSFGSGFDLTEHLMYAASGPVNRATQNAFLTDMESASQFFDRDNYSQRNPLGDVDIADARPYTNDAMEFNAGSAQEFFERDNYYRRGAPESIADASGAGYMGGKSAYIEPNGGGYRERIKQSLLDDDIPLRRSPFENSPEIIRNPRARGVPTIRISDYRKAHLAEVTRGLSKLL